MPVWKKILCAVDFSAPSRAALVQAAELAADRAAELALLHVRDIPVRQKVGMAPGDAGQHEAELAEAWKQLQRAAADAEAIAHSPVALEMIEGAPAHEIVRSATNRGVDLVVVGTHGRTGVRRAVLGSVAEHVVRGAPCAVLVVRPERLLDPTD